MKNYHLEAIKDGCVPERIATDDPKEALDWYLARVDSCRMFMMGECFDKPLVSHPKRKVLKAYKTPFGKACGLVVPKGGRPLVGGEKRQQTPFFLTTSERELLARMGDGNMTTGLRRAIDLYVTQ